MKTPIAIITLNPDSERMHELTSQLSRQELTYEVALGADGRKHFPTLKNEERVDQLKSLKMRLVQLTKSEVGCYLSHFRTIKNAYNKGLKRICILEDDVMIESNFGQVLGLLEMLPDEYEHIRLMGLKRHKRKNILQISEDCWITRPLKGLCGTQGYVLNRSGMKKVLQHGRVISEPIDKFYDHFWDINLKSYCIEPHVIWERPIIKSSITKVSRKEAASQDFVKKLKKHFIKVQRGFNRRMYLLRCWGDFYPAKKPAIPMGKTVRIK